MVSGIAASNSDNTYFGLVPQSGASFVERDSGGAPVSTLKRRRTNDTYCDSSPDSDSSVGGDGDMVSRETLWEPEADYDEISDLFHSFPPYEDYAPPMCEPTLDTWVQSTSYPSMEHQQQPTAPMMRGEYSDLSVATHNNIQSTRHPRTQSCGSFNRFLQFEPTVHPLCSAPTSLPLTNWQDVTLDIPVSHSQNCTVVPSMPQPKPLTASQQRLKHPQSKTTTRTVSPVRSAKAKPNTLHSPKKKTTTKRPRRTVKRLTPAKVCTCKIPTKETNTTKPASAASLAQLVTDPNSKEFTSRYRGVCWYKRTGKWVVQIKINGKRKHIGYFTSEQEAANAYDEALRDLLISQQKEMEVFKKNQIKFRAPRRREFNQCPVHSGTTSK